MDVEDWLVDWFAEHASVERSQIDANRSADYFERGWIDSLQAITLISEVEGTFDVEFSNDEFQNQEFTTITGFAGIIKSKRDD